MNDKNILITGGLGFIGTNATLHFLSKDYDVYIIDNISRETSVKNFEIIKNTKAHILIGDICDKDFVNKTVKANKFEAIIHLAAQVAVTTSIIDPQQDFNVNIIGTFNILEAIRIHSSETILLNASTNKVYGSLKDRKYELTDKGYSYIDCIGIDESEQLDFYTPYGCSKGSADQYVLDYARIFNLKTYSFRQSCVYGTYQYGVEDQGWISWFMLAAFQNKSITVYGDGHQTRDILYVSDLIDLYEKAIVSKKNYGQAYNVGGGIDNFISVNNVLTFINDNYKVDLVIKHNDWRPGDQKVFIANIDKAKQHFEWKPQINITNGLQSISQWCINLQ